MTLIIDVNAENEEAAYEEIAGALEDARDSGYIQGYQIRVALPIRVVLPVVKTT
jgi:hypothetical protein